MKTELITIQPQVIQFSRQTVQTIKITNNTSSSLNNFFFCLYNVQKFAFKPQSFSLAPNQHKLIQISLKIKSTKSIAKQFAYLKSTDINKRLTLLINNFHSPQSRTKQTEEGYSDMNTLSSRDYHELHNRALNKIITEQQKYMIGENSSSGRKDYNKTENFTIGSSQKVNFMNQQYMKQMQVRNIMLEKQVQELHSILNQRTFELQKIDNQNKFLSDQGSKFMKKLNDKQERITQLQKLYERIVFQNQSNAKQIINLKEIITVYHSKQGLTKKQQNQKNSSLNKIFQNYQSRIKELENLVQSSERQQISKFNKQFKKKIQQKQQQLQQIRKKLQHQQLLLKQHQINVLKIQNEKKNLQESKKKLQISNKQMQQLNNNLREQIYVYKSKVQQNSNSKIHQYLQIALESYKNQNQNLKKSKNQLEKSLQSIMVTSRQHQYSKKQFQNKIDKLNREINKLSTQLNLKQSEIQNIKQNHHQQIKQIQEKNILLLQKISEENNTKRELQVDRLKKEIHQKQREIQRITQNMNTSTERQVERIKELEQENHTLQQLNAKLEQKVKKYKKQTKKQLKSINDNAFDQLKRIHQQKKQLSKKVQKLQKTISDLQTKSYHNQDLQSNNSKSNIHLQRKKNLSRQNEEQEYNQNLQSHANIRSKSQYEVNAVRKVGIINQRDRLEDSRSVSNKNGYISGNNQVQVNPFEFYQLKQFSTFFYNQQQRFQYMFNLQQQLADPLDYNGNPLANVKPLYKAIKFFKVIQNKIKSLQQKNDQSMILNKQNQFMRERLSQLQKQQYRQQNKKDVSLLTKNAQNGVDDSPSFLVNRTNLTNLNTFEIIEFMKQQMKKQYNKQKQTIKFIEDKYQILKKKIYRQYRTRIIEILNTNKQSFTKDKKQSLITNFQNLIQRFIQSLSNVTHKEAVLNKEIKIKNITKQQNTRLKQKVNQLEHLLSQKHHGNCNRDPVKVFNCSAFLNNTNINCNKQQQWIESIKLSTQLLTEKAENQRLRQQLQVVRQDFNDLRQQLDQALQKNEAKDMEIIKLKQSQHQLKLTYDRQIQRQNKILEDQNNKIISGDKSKSKGSTKQNKKIKQKQKQLDVIRDQLEKKNTVIKGYKQKQKKWQQFMLQTNHMEQKQKNIAASYRRLEQNNAMVKQSNRQLRQQNTQLKQIVQKLQKQLERKKIYIKNLKNEQQQSRITKPLRIQQSIQQIKQLQQVLRTTKEQLAKIKKLKEKEIIKLEGELTSARNQALIHIKSLQSVIRATIQTVRKLFASLKILLKRKGIASNVRQQFTVPQNLVQINATQIYEQFQQILQALQR